jgi:hypothetical protein
MIVFIASNEIAEQRLAWIPHYFSCKRLKKIKQGTTFWLEQRKRPLFASLVQHLIKKFRTIKNKVAFCG